MALVTKSQQLVTQLRDAIQSGRWAPGEKIPGEFELQAEFGVSRNTIRDALASLANDGIIIRKHGSGTYVSEKSAANAYVVVATDAVRMSSLAGYWYRVLVEEAQERIASAGYKAVLAIGSGKTDDEFMESINIQDDIANNKIAGVLDLTSRMSFLKYVESMKVPIVQIECSIPTSTFSVVLDYTELTKKAVTEFNKYGYDDFALMHYSFSEAEMRDPVYNDFMRLIMAAINNDESRLVLSPGHPNPQNAYNTFKEWWLGPNRRRAIMFFDDSLFDVASRAILELGIDVPNELAILTHANVGRVLHFPTRMCRIGFDPVTAMSQAWGLLRKIIQSEPVFDAVVKVSPVYFEGDSLFRSEMSNSSNTQDTADNGGNRVEIGSVLNKK